MWLLLVLLTWVFALSACDKKRQACGQYASRKDARKSSRSSRKSSKSRRLLSKSGSSSCRRRGAFYGGSTPLPAKPSELRVVPSKLSYKVIGGLKGVDVINATNERKFFKVCCSDNMLYRVEPVFGVLEPGKTAWIHILRKNGAAKNDKIVIITTNAEDGELLSKEVFQCASDTEMMVLPLLVEE